MAALTPWQRQFSEFVHSRGTFFSWRKLQSLKLTVVQILQIFLLGKINTARTEIVNCNGKELFSIQFISADKKSPLLWGLEAVLCDFFFLSLRFLNFEDSSSADLRGIYLSNFYFSWQETKSSDYFCPLFVLASCDLSPLNAFDSGSLQNIRLILCLGKKPTNYFKGQL